MKNLKSSIMNIIKFLKKLNRPVTKFINKGLSYKTILDKIVQFPYKLPNDLIMLYEVINGTKIVKGDILNDFHFFPGFYFLSIEDAMSHYNAFKNDNRWEKNWFPVFANGGGDFYVVSCMDSETGTAPVIGFLLGEENHPVDYSSITNMIFTIEECFQKGAFFQDKDGYLEIKDDAHISIAQKYNPDVKLWFE